MADLVKLKKLRSDTGISFSLCKKALEESQDNIEKAKKLLNQWGIEKAEDKKKRETSQGAIFSYVHHNHKVASLIELLCETDFVADNKDFQALGQEIAMQAASMPADNLDQLIEQEYIRDPSKKIGDLIQEAVMKFGENIKINRYNRWVLGIDH
ncbi:elongation factor Ts [Candidatus Roizmanbacteria bacterium]|jgi:elongation factor Ts|nr:elongation factor Ts [Candidatus Roizmanbacteria bacterium]